MVNAAAASPTRLPDAPDTTSHRVPLGLVQSFPGTPGLSFVGRQPIFDRGLQTYAYELLFRLGDGTAPGDVGPHGSACTAQVVLHAFVDIGLDSVVGDRLAFVNVTREWLCNGLAHQLPASRVVIEVLEDIFPDDEVLEALRKLKEAGYVLALDDFVFRAELRPLVELAGLVKIDISVLRPDEVEQHVTQLRAPGRRLLAERVETLEAFEWCKSLGFDYFQGFFLARPSLVCASRRPSNKLTALRLLALLDDQDTPLTEIETAISLDPTLSYRLLRVINSAAFGLAARVDSLRQALVLLGLRRVHAWVTLMVLAGLSHKPPELLHTALIRARMCERLATRLPDARAPSLFTVGLFSALDAMLDTPLPQLIEPLPLSADVSGALLSGTGTMGEVLRAVIAYERCDWDAVACTGLTPADFRDAYVDALQWLQHALSVYGRAL